MRKINLHLINPGEFEQEFNNYPKYYEQFGLPTLEKLQQEVQEAGAQDCIMISTSPSQYSVFELLHVQGADVYYTFIIRVKATA